MKLVIFVFAIAASMQALALSIGVGKSDITGLVFRTPFMGYSDSKQKSVGIHTRLFSRAFYFEQNQKRAVFVSSDLGMISQLVKIEVVKRLKQKYGELFDHDNVMLSATHTHSGQGGFFHFRLYRIASEGYSKSNFEIIVSGIVSSIEKAVSGAKKGSIKFSQGDLFGVNYNQSQIPYYSNKDASLYKHNTNTNMTLIKLVDEEKKLMGIINWFSVHPTTLSKRNRHISGDNKGEASILMERQLGDNVVAAFANSDEGDVSSDIFTDDQWKNLSEFERNSIIAKKQLKKANELLGQAKEELGDQVDYRHSWVNMPELLVHPKYSGHNANYLCPPALGFSFATGSEDGPSGVPYFHEGMTVDNTPNYLNFFLKVINPIVKRTKEIDRCHAPKPVLIVTGNREKSWTPEVLPFQIFRIGKLAILGIPGELTTMGGRRLRHLILNELKSIGVKYVVVAGLANTYSGYITTFEEYQLQHYEGASTHFGPHTFAAYLQEFHRIARNLKDGGPAKSEEAPELKPKNEEISKTPARDKKRRDEDFGQVLVSPENEYKKGSVVKAHFRGPHPNRNQSDGMIELQVKNDQGVFVPFMTESSPQLNFEWKRDGLFFCHGCFRYVISIHTGPDFKAGEYRLKFSGKATPRGKTLNFESFTENFLIK